MSRHEYSLMSHEARLKCEGAICQAVGNLLLLWTYAEVGDIEWVIKTCRCSTRAASPDNKT